MSDRSSLRSETLGKNKKKKNNFLIPSLVFDFIIIGCLATFAYYLRFTSTFNGFSRFFLCDDPSLKYPYYGGSEGEVQSPVSSWTILTVDDVYFYSIGALVPPLICLIGELLYMCLAPRSHKIITTCCDCFRVPLVVRRLCRYVGVFWVGMLLLSILTDSLKLLSGQQRPYFLNVPSIETYTDRSNAPYCIVNSTATEEIRDASLSFPSYHSTFAAYAATFTSCYIQVMFDVHGSYFFRPILSSAVAGSALLVSYSQWMLYRNSWMDIAVGNVIGFLVAIYISFCIVNGFKEHQPIFNDDYNFNDERPFEGTRPAIFRWVHIPRLTLRKRLPPNLAHKYLEQSNLDGNSVFENELSRTRPNGQVMY